MGTEQYRRIAAEIAENITNGTLQPGDRVPSARQITRQWSVSINTASKVLAELRDQGLVIARTGSGTIVSPTPAVDDDHMAWYNQQLGARVHQARKSAGWTQSELARELGLTRSSVANIESGRQRLQCSTLMDVADLLNADPRWLLTGGQDTPGAPARRFSRANRDQLTRAGRDIRAVADALDTLARGTSGGAVLTDELLDRLADEAERGYDPGRLHPRSRRPPAP